MLPLHFSYVLVCALYLAPQPFADGSRRHPSSLMQVSGCTNRHPLKDCLYFTIFFSVSSSVLETSSLLLLLGQFFAPTVAWKGVTCTLKRGGG